jgi:two-component system, NarL family, nitrate/nitrite response regulator NarL
MSTNPLSGFDKMTRILLADDHQLIAEAVSAVLSMTGGFIVDLANSLSSTLQTLKKQEPYEIVMLDLRMPGMDGIASVKKVVDSAQNAQVVLFSANADNHTVARAIEVGARGLIPKTLPLQSLESVLRLIQSGQLFVPAEAPVPGLPVERAFLSKDELVVLQRAASGMTNKSIANNLDENEAKIKMHMRSICRKLNARNRAHAAMIGRDMGIIDF